jgi:hypothetical protein
MGVLQRMGLRKDPPPRTVVAAAMPMSGPDVRRAGRARTAHQGEEQWQREAWYYFDAFGEVRGPMVWIANAVSQADVYAAELDENGKVTGPTEDTRAQAAAALVFGGAQNQPRLLRIAALCWMVAGEAWIIVRPRGGGRPDEWLVLSDAKVRTKGQGWEYDDPFTGVPVALGTNDRLIRLWDPHPNDQAKADSAMRSALPPCREAEKYSQAILSRLNARISLNGVMVLAEELDFPKGDFDTSAESFADTLLQAFEFNLKNPGDASASAPVTVTAPGELVANDGWAKHLDLATEMDGELADKRAVALQRIAMALDMPRDVAEGTQGESNHWTAWQVEESTYKIFIEPLLTAIGDAVTEFWFHSVLAAMGEANPQRFTLGWDTTAIVARPDDTENLRDLHDRILISDDYMATENGIPEDARPGDEERTRRLLEKIVMGAPTLLADPNVAEALGLDIEVAPAAAGVAGQIEGGQLQPEPAAEPAPNALPERAAEPDDGDVPEGLTAAAELLVFDALSRAGGRLLTREHRGQFGHVPKHELHTVIAADPGQIERIKEGSFQFVEPVAEAFGRDPVKLRRTLSVYVNGLLHMGAAHDRERLRRIL